jgi:hypothetical protein
MTYATVAFVRGLSFSAEFDGFSDASILLAIDEASVHYGSSVDRGASVKLVTFCEGLHAAHLLHMGKKKEAGEDADNLPGAVKSASLAGVGSWTFESAAGGNEGGEGNGPIPDWKKSPYGERWRTKYTALPCGITAVPGSFSG